MVQHTGEKWCEELTGIVWSGRCFRMKLHGEDGPFPMPHAFNGVVIEVDVRGLEGLRHGRGINRKTVVFGGDEHALGVQVADRLIGPVMAKFELQGLSATRQDED